MAQRRISMKRVREALRLHFECGLSLRKTARALSVSRPVVTEYLDKCNALKITYEKARDMSDEELLSCFNSENTTENPRLISLRDKFPEYARELTRIGVTRQLLWVEYHAENPNGYSYSQFCYHFQQWNDNQEIYMRMEHKAGDKLFVDFAGKKMEVVDQKTGEIKQLEIFVAALGASKLIYAEAVHSQKKNDFIQAQVNALRYIGGVPEAIVPDCLKSAVTKGHRYEPDINPEYQDFARHYNTTILAARPYKPRDKALVEGSVRTVYQHIYAPLRNRVFHSIEDLNKAIREKLEMLNKRPMQIYGVSRWELFREIEKDALSSLPVENYTLRNYKSLKVQFNYHIYLSEDKHYYSVPYFHRGKQLDVLYTATIVEIYLNNARIALHRRNFRQGGYTTIKDHMPPEHKFMNDWNAEKFLTWAEGIGSHVREAIDTILWRKEHPEQGYRVCLGILNLRREFGNERLDKACKRALHLDNVSYRIIKNILENGLENMSDEKESSRQLNLFSHENIRGPEYYH